MDKLDKQEDESKSSIHRWPAQAQEAAHLPVIEGEYDSEIDLTATEVTQHAHSSPEPDSQRAPLPQDPALVLSVMNAELTVNPGAAVTLRVQMLNNGDRTANFELRIEGWIDAGWVTNNPIRQELLPGQPAIVQTEIAPPREPRSQAGKHQLVLVLRSADYPGRESRQHLLLHILPYDEIVVKDIKPRLIHCSWGARSANFRTSLVNQSNHAVQIRLYGEGERSHFHLAQEDVETTWHLQQLNHVSNSQNDLLLELEAGARQTIQGRIWPDRLPLFRIRQTPIRLLASHVGKQLVPRTASARLISHPLLSPRQVVLISLLLIFMLFAVAALSATGLGLVQLVDNLPQRTVETDRASQEQLPAYAIVLPVDEVVPAPQTSPPLAENTSETSSIHVENEQQADVPNTNTGRQVAVPLVEAGQVSAPGEAAPTSASVVTPAPSPTSAELTYAQMFQEIGLRFDLDWRMLAAQAYVESKFDTLALGSDGDLGLMQILPRTWQEWAPIVDVNDPFDAYSNALVAAVYLDYLRTNLGQQGYPEIRWMLVAYNWGPDQVNRFLADGNRWEDLPDSLQQYANEILRIAESLPQ